MVHWYIQAFSDGNKRTARITSNAILIANGYCPLSFRSVDSIDYKKAMLIFYEQNNLYAFKQIFTIATTKQPPDSDPTVVCLNVLIVR